MKTKALLISCALLIGFVPLTLLAQSPRNSLAYGSFIESTNPGAQALGHALTAYHDSIQIIGDNPAEIYGFPQVIAFFSFESHSTRWWAEDQEITNVGGGFGYFSLALPLGQSAGALLSVEPITDLSTLMNYNADSTTNFSMAQGGGIWSMAVAFGYRLNKMTSLGMRWRYLYGLFDRREVLNYPNTRYRYNIYQLKGRIAGQNLQLGIQYAFTPRFRLGGTFEWGLSTPVFEGNAYDYDIPRSASNDDYLEKWRYFQAVGQPGGVVDTIPYNEVLEDWPWNVEIGFAYRRGNGGHFLLALSQRYFPQEAFRHSEIFRLPEGWRGMSSGALKFGYYQKARDEGSRFWLDRLSWRVGFIARNLYVTPRSNDYVRSTLMAVGFSLPAKHHRYRISPTLVYEHWQAADGLPEESRWSLEVGLYLQEKWFGKFRRR